MLAHVLCRPQDEVEVTEVQKGGPVRRAVLERGACLVVDMHFAVYVWKGKGATLDARNIGLQLARDLAGPREVAAKDGEGRVASVCPVVVLASDCDDALFLSKFVDTQWVVYADLAKTSRIAASSNTKPKETSVSSLRALMDMHASSRVRDLRALAGRCAKCTR